MKTIKISSFNIRCFGTDGDYTKPLHQDSRLKSLKKFLETKLSDSDVICFQEILSEKLLSHILPKGFKWKTYNHSYKRHQKIVFAYKGLNISSVELIPIQINNTTSRPGVATSIQINKQITLNLVGLHLKSGLDHCETRLKQIKTLTKHLNLAAPNIVLGDANTQTDLENSNEAFRDVNLVRIENNKSTYITAWESGVLDHIWISSHIKVLKFEVYSVDEYVAEAGREASIKRYYKEISDHAPISLLFQV